MRKRIASRIALTLGLIMLALNIHAALASHVQVALLGDVNHDGKVNITDVYEAAVAFGSTPESPRWNANADIDGNGKITIADLLIICTNFGKTA